MPPAEPSFLATIQSWAHDLLLWVGFGTVVGLVARTFVPSRDNGGTLGTLLMGIGGVVIGCGTLAFFSPGIRISPISPLGFFAATGGAFVILFFFRVLSTGSLDGGPFGRLQPPASRGGHRHRDAHRPREAYRDPEPYRAPEPYYAPEPRRAAEVHREGHRAPEPYRPAEVREAEPLPRPRAAAPRPAARPAPRPRPAPRSSYSLYDD